MVFAFTLQARCVTVIIYVVLLEIDLNTSVYWKQSRADDTALVFGLASLLNQFNSFCRVSVPGKHV